METGEAPAKFTLWRQSSMASDRDYESLIDLDIEQEDGDVVDIDSRLKLMYLVNEGDLEGIKELLAAGTDVNFRDIDHRTALHVAACQGYEDVALLLLENGAEVDIKDRWGSTVKGYVGEEQLGEALKGSDVVIIPAGVPRKPGMTRDDLFKINAGIVKSLSEAIAEYCPKALVNMISNPVNSTVPIAAEVFKSKGVYDEKRLLGVTTLDVVRAKTFYAGKSNANVADVNVPVVGGHAGITILPLFSQANPKVNMSDEVIKALTQRTQDGGTEVVEAKAGKGSATLSMAYAGALFADACLKGLNGVPDVVECSFVQSTVTDLPFFASKVRLGKNGVEEVLGLGSLSDYEQEGLEALKSELKASIDKGIAFAHQAS